MRIHPPAIAMIGAMLIGVSCICALLMWLVAAVVFVMIGLVLCCGSLTIGAMQYLMRKPMKPLLIEQHEAICATLESIHALKEKSAEETLARLNMAIAQCQSAKKHYEAFVEGHRQEERDEHL